MGAGARRPVAAASSRGTDQAVQVLTGQMNELKVSVENLEKEVREIALGSWLLANELDPRPYSEISILPRCVFHVLNLVDGWI